MKTTCDLQMLSKDLRDMPRHLWDDHLRGFCEALLLEHSGLERARIPAKVECPTAEFARRVRQRSRR
jgi:hypothetical protein